MTLIFKTLKLQLQKAVKHAIFSYARVVELSPHAPETAVPLCKLTGILVRGTLPILEKASSKFKVPNLR